MENDFWLNRWKKGEIGWHQKSVEPSLENWAASRKPTRILVPLCGKSLDLLWLAQHGYHVVGVELSSVACEAFFLENKIPFQKQTQGEFTVYQSSHVSLYSGDFFKFTSALLGTVGAVYDRAALIALPALVREKYTRHLKLILSQSLLSKDFEFLQIILTRTPEDPNGPPFSVTISELERHYQANFNFKIISKEAVEARGPEGSKTAETVILLQPAP